MLLPLPLATVSTSLPYRWCTPLPAWSAWHVWSLVRAACSRALRGTC